MFTSKAAKAQTTADASSTDRLTHHRSTLVAHRSGQGVAGLEHAFRNTINDQAMPRLLAQRRLGPVGKQAGGAENMMAPKAPHGALWDFSKIPLFPPDRSNHPQTPGPTNPDVAPRLARNPDDSTPPVEQEDSPPASSLLQLDAPAMTERDAGDNSSLQVTSNFAGGNPTFTNLGFAVLCKSPSFNLAGQISVSPARANGDLTVGFMQVVLGATGPKGRYFDADGAPYMTAFKPYAGVPLRDADPSGPFYGSEAQRTVDSLTVSVSMSDAPQAALLWTTPDGKGTLQQVTGEDQFVTWLVTKSDATGKIEPLRYITWSVGWFAAVDQSQPSGISFDVGKIIDAGGGNGPMAPIRSGPVANDSLLPTQWESWK